MKKLLIVLVLIGVTAGAFAQDVFASYNEPGNFNIYASGRMTAEEAAARATFSGDRAWAEQAFRSFSVLY